MSLKEEIITALKTVLPEDGKPYALHEPCFGGNEKKYVCECIDTGWVSSVGGYVDKFEQVLAKACGVKYAVVTVNGTSALHTAISLAGVESDDEVLIPSLTFIATANAVSYCGGIPHFVDCSKDTLGIDPEKLDKYLEQIARTSPSGTINKKTGRRLAAIVPVHIFGHPVDMEALNNVAGKYAIPVIEDAAESLGSTYKSRPCGSYGKLAALSFNGNKIITTGGGGAILTDDEELASLAKHLTTTAKKPHQWAFDHNPVGYNYRMPNINAALGCAQLEQLEGFVSDKRRLADLYDKAFAEVKGVSFFKESENVKSNYWLNAVVLDEDVSQMRDEILEYLHENGFLCRPVWNLMHSLPMYKNCPRMDLEVSKSLEKRIINLPSSAKLGRGYGS